MNSLDVLEVWFEGGFLDRDPLMSVLLQLPDMVYSAMKREEGVKDSRALEVGG